MSRTSAAWKKVRDAGGSILSPDGENLTTDSEGADAFEGAMKALCLNNAGALHNVLTSLEQAAANAAWIAEANALPTTKPKCASKPIARLSVGCSVEVEFVPRDKNEEQCS